VLEKDLGMFDIIIGNPPYQAVTDTVKDNTQGDFWFKFLKHAMKTNPKYITYITPKSIFSSGRFGTDAHKVTNILQSGYGFTHIWTDTTKYFDVGIQTVAFTLKKGYKGKTLLVDRNEEITIDEDRPLPFYLSKINQDIVKKCLNTDNRWEFKEKTYPEPEDYIIGINAGRYKQYKKLYVGVARNNPNSPAQTLHIDRNKVSNYKSIFNSKLFSYMFKVMGGEAAQSSTGILQSLPYIEPIKEYTDKQLYKMFDLNPKEIEKIESMNVE